jgi:hypothetical protein
VIRVKQGDDDNGETADQVGSSASGRTASRRQPLDTGSLQHPGYVGRGLQDWKAKTRKKGRRALSYETVVDWITR